MKPIVVGPEQTEPDIPDVKPAEFAEMFEFLHDEWLEADKFLEDRGIPAHSDDEFGQRQFRTLKQRIKLAIDDETT